MKNQIEKAARFVALHERKELLLLPNPWDCGSARILQWVGFEALATTSAGLAFSKGVLDGAVSRGDVMKHLVELCACTDVPVTADLENGFGDAPECAAAAILEAAWAGAVGASIEDGRRGTEAHIYPIRMAAERVRAAAEAARKLPFKFVLTARAEHYLYGRYDLKDTIERLQAYQEAGADVLFAPGLRRLADIETVVQSVDRPVNINMGLEGERVGVDELRALGVRRVSLGGSMWRGLLGGLVGIARDFKERGSLDFIDKGLAGATVREIMLDEPGQ
jgi:2-methylisocitrate lyase-like PEP mutase family enzyme